MAWNVRSWFWPDCKNFKKKKKLPDWNGLEWCKSILASLEWLEMVGVGFGLTGMAWIGRSQFWLDWNGLEWRKRILALLKRLGMGDVCFGLTGMAWN
jgi:hypothetical protein